MLSENNCMQQFDNQSIVEFVVGFIGRCFDVTVTLLSTIIALFMIVFNNKLAVQEIKSIKKKKFGKFGFGFSGFSSVKSILMSNSCRRVDQMQQKSIIRYYHWHCQSNICCCNYLSLRVKLLLLSKKWNNFMTNVAQEYRVMMRV